MQISAPYATVWSAIEDDPAEAARLTLLTDLMIVLEEHIRTMAWTQQEAAKRLGVTQPRISDLVRGKINLFSIDSVIGMLTTAGLQVEINVKDAA